MSDTEEHALLGAAVGFGSYLAVKRMLNEEVDLGNALRFGVFGAGAAVLPDVLEPATTPKHRAAAHSLITGATLLQVMKSVWGNTGLNSGQKAAATALLAAYLSHLALDANTPAGLPVI